MFAPMEPEPRPESHPTPPEWQRRNELVAVFAASRSSVGAAAREQLRLIVEVDEADLCLEEGARSTAHWLCMYLGVSSRKNHRLLAAAHALEHLPLIAEALIEGDLSLDKVLELSRFATKKNEEQLVLWAQGVSYGAIRHRVELEAKRRLEEVIDAQRYRALNWYYSVDGSRFELQASLPAARGATVIRALERVTETIPVMPGEEDHHCAPQRRADALLALCSARITEDPDPDRATVIIHAQLEGLRSNAWGSETQDGAVLHPESVRRMLCNARIQTVVEDENANVVAIGPMHREPPAWMARQVRYRDKECRFPGCGAKAYTEAHHVKFWSHGGRTELANLLLICSFHHTLVHELRWRVTRSRDGTVTWFRPGGAEYRQATGGP